VPPYRARCLKTADALIGAPLCRALGLLPSVAVREPAALAVRPENLRRLLVIRPGGMGDMVLLLPLLRRLQRGLPQVRIELICERRNLDVLRLAGLAEAALPYDARPAACLRRLRRGAYDAAIDTEQFHHFSAVLALLSRAPIRIGFKINPVRNPLYTHLINYAPDGPEAAQFMRLLAPLGLDTAPPEPAGSLADLRLEPDPALAERLRAFAGGEPFAAVHPGAGSPYKQWPAERFAELAAALRRELGLKTVWVGGAADRRTCARAAELASALAAPCLPLPSARLDDAAFVIRQARLFIGADSGLAHLATALDARAVVLFGPSDDAKWGLRDTRRAVARQDLPCAPCFIFGYHKPCRTAACMRRISVADVLAQCRRVL